MKKVEREAEETGSACPRFMLAACRSGAGKTTVTCALLRALQKRGRRISAFKCGPDYIDPMFYREILGTESGNLDLFFQDGSQLRGSLLRYTAHSDLAVIEGVMGYYDGMGMDAGTSCARIAQVTDTPVILVLDCRGRALSALAELYGFLHFREEGGRIRGVICNCLPERLYPAAAERIREMGVVPLGYLPERKDLQLASRHLGLVTPAEIGDFQEQADALADCLAQSVDLDAVEQLALSAAAVSAGHGSHSAQHTSLREHGKDPSETVRIALAWDKAFCFYYRENIDALRERGCEIIHFSPLRDPVVPACDALILPGGYPELYAQALQENESMRTDIRERIRKGLPAIAECGGFLYLHGVLEDEAGKTFQGAGLWDGKCAYRGFQRQFGYVCLHAERDQLLAAAGDVLKGHEFHYFVSEIACDAFRAEKPDLSRSWMAAVGTDSLYAGFPHISFTASPLAADRFVRAATEWKKKNGT